MRLIGLGRDKERVSGGCSRNCRVGLDGSRSASTSPSGLWCIAEPELGQEIVLVATRGLNLGAQRGRKRWRRTRNVSDLSVEESSDVRIRAVQSKPSQTQAHPFHACGWSRRK